MCRDGVLIMLRNHLSCRHPYGVTLKVPKVDGSVTDDKKPVPWNLVDSIENLRTGSSSKLAGF